jgi:hypothetical protein
MKQYSILSVANHEYRKFAYVFAKSALEYLNLSHIHEICILDTGLHEDDVAILKQLSDKIVIVPSDNIIKTMTTWDDGWQQNVILKTWFAQKYIEDNNLPTCMVDIDCMFINDISDIMNTEGDVVLCNRSDIWPGMPYIASFVAFLKPDNSLRFVRHWRELMNMVTGFSTRETPALNDIVRENVSYEILAAPHQLVGLYHEDKLIPETRVLHFKGGGMSENVSMEEAVAIRMQRFEKYKNKITEYLYNV